MVESLVGRQAELASLDAFLARTREGPCALFLEGEAGIGKSRLWKEGVERARKRGVRVLSTHPGGGEVKLAFAGLADLLDDDVSSLLPHLPPPQRRALEIALLLEEPDGTPADERAVAAAFRNCLRHLAGAAPVLLAVDDIQWLDPASARVLAFACRRLGSEPVGLLATVRIAPDETEPAELAAAFAGDRVEHRAVGPLTVAALYELVREHLKCALSRPALLRIHEASGGNPFFALELARALQRAGSDPASDEPLPVPANLRALVRGRLALLPRPASETLRLVAGLARPTVGAVELAVGSSDRADRDLEAAVEAGVIEVVGDAIRFTHPLLASIHFSSGAPGTRRAVHRRLAGVVADQEERARHLALAADGPGEEVATALADAAEVARKRGAIAAGAELAEQSLALTPVELLEETHRRTLVAAELRYAAGNTSGAVELIQSALAHARHGRRRAELWWLLGKTMFEKQDTRVALDFWHRALNEVGVDDLLRARILESLTFAASKHEGTQAARSYIREAAVVAERLGDRATLARALAQMAHLEFVGGGALETDVFERAVALEEELGGLELDYGPTAFYTGILLAAGDLTRARVLLERLCDRGRKAGDAAVSSPLLELAWVEFNTGNWDRAEELAREGYDVAVQSGRETVEPRAMFTLATIEAAQGKCDQARRRAEQALVLTEACGWGSSGPRGVLAILDLSLENYEAAYEVLMPAIESNRELGMPVIDELLDAAEALAGLGRTEEGRALLARCDEAPGPMNVTWAIGAAARTNGLLSAAEGDLVAGEASLEEAVATIAETGDPFDLARTLLALGTVQRQARKKRSARLTLGRALDILAGLGAEVWAERARRELARIGGRSAPRGELSGTEADIVELVVLGRTNKEVAEALHLSAKTVEWNLSKIYKRLGVHSRTELAAAQRTPAHTS